MWILQKSTVLVVLLISLFYTEDGFSLSCFPRTQLITNSIGGNGFLIVSVPKPKNSIKEYEFLLVSKKDSIPLRVVDIINNGYFYNQLIFKKGWLSWFSDFKDKEYTLIAKDKMKQLVDLGIQDKTITAIPAQMIEPPRKGRIIDSISIVTPDANVRYLKLNTDLKDAVVRVLIRDSNGNEYYHYDNVPNTGSIVLGRKGCLRNFKFKMKESYKVSLQVISDDGRFSEYSNEVTFLVEPTKGEVQPSIMFPGIEHFDKIMK